MVGLTYDLPSISNTHCRHGRKVIPVLMPSLAEPMSYNLFNIFRQDDMNAISSREVIHNFASVAARVAAGEELTVTRYGKPVLKLVQVRPSELDNCGRAALIQKALSVRMTAPYGKKFEREDAYAQ